MRYLFLSLTILLLATSCTPIKVQTRAQYQSESFHPGRLKTDGVAVLPTTSIEFDTVIQRKADHYVGPYTDYSYLKPRLTAQILNESNTLSTYRKAMETYEKTEISDRKKFGEIGTALRLCYLLKIYPRMITTKQETESSSFFYDDEIDISNIKIRKNMLSAIIIDCSSGEVAWEGFSKLTSSEGDYFYNRPDDSEIVKKNISALMEQLIYRSNNY